jgi:hypothetical protein
LEESKRWIFTLDLDHHTNTVVQDKAAQTQTQSLCIDKGAETHALYDTLYGDMEPLARRPIVYWKAT